MNVSVEEVFADADQFNSIRITSEEEERDQMVKDGWTYCQREVTVHEGMESLFKGMTDGSLTVYVMGRMEDKG